MLNKIRIVGKLLSTQLKERTENRELFAYFSLLVTNPNGVQTILRCHANEKMVAELEEESIKKDEMVEVRGYLKNERESRQIIIQALELRKLESDDSKSSFNQARLLGIISTELEIQEKEERDHQVVSFKLEVPTKENISNLFFCRAQGELVLEMANALKKRDIVLLEGFLQTKKIVDDNTYPEKILRISSFICQSFILIDTMKVDNFYLLDKLTLVSKEVEKIDFLKPRKNFEND